MKKYILHLHQMVNIENNKPLVSKETLKKAKKTVNTAKDNS